MRKRTILPLMFAFAIAAVTSACSASTTTQTSTTAATTAAATTAAQAETTKAETETSTAAAADTQSFSGVLESKKNVSFIVTGNEGVSYGFTFESENQAPEGYDTVNEGDNVIVYYEGELSEVDANLGAVSIEKQ